MNEMKAWGNLHQAFVDEMRAQIEARQKLANSTDRGLQRQLEGMLQEEQREAEQGPAAK